MMSTSPEEVITETNPHIEDGAGGDDDTTLHSAAIKGITEVFSKALESPNHLLFKTDPDGNIPFHLAAREGQLRIVELFCNHGSQHCAVHLQDAASSSTSIRTPPGEEGKEIDGDGDGDDHQPHRRTLWAQCLTVVNEKSGDLAIHMALKKEQRKVALYMLQSVPWLASMVNSVQESPLYLAVEGFCDEVMENILSSDDDRSYSVSGPSGRTALHAAVMCRNWSALRLIVNKRLMINIADDDGKTPLHYAVEENQEDTVKHLMESDHMTACKYDNEGYTPLLRAAEIGSVKMIKTILKHCPYSLEFHHKFTGATALHLAKMEAKSILICLAGTNMCDLINERDCNGYTPLHLAIVESDYDKVFALTFYGDSNWRVRCLIHDQDDGSSMRVRPIDQLSGNASKHVDSMDQLLATSFLDITDQQNQPRKSKSSNKGIIQNYGYMIRPVMPRRQSNMVRKFIETNMNEEDISAKLSNIFLVAGLIMTITFAAAFTIPGGYIEDTGQIRLINSSDNTTAPTTSRMKKFSGPLLTVFLMSDSAAMIYSAIILMWYAWSFTSTTIKENVRLLFQLGYFLFWCSLLTIGAFAAAFIAVTAVQRKEAEWLILLIGVISVSLLQGISGTLVVNFFPVRGKSSRLAMNWRVMLAYAKLYLKRAIESLTK